jgi:hypothetical protein
MLSLPRLWLRRFVSCRRRFVEQCEAHHCVRLLHVLQLDKRADRSSAESAWRKEKGGGGEKKKHSKKQSIHMLHILWLDKHDDTSSAKSSASAQFPASKVALYSMSTDDTIT